MNNQILFKKDKNKYFILKKTKFINKNIMFLDH